MVWQKRSMLGANTRIESKIFRLKNAPVETGAWVN
jgi:hypothetical protein